MHASKMPAIKEGAGKSQKIPKINSNVVGTES